MENNNNSSKYVWGIIMPVIIMFIIQNAVDLFLVEWLMVYNLANYSTGSYVEFVTSILDQAVSTDMNTAISIGYSVISIFLFGYLYIKNFSSKERVQKPFKGISDNPVFTVVGLVILAVGLQYICIYVMNAVAMARPDWMEAYEELLETAGLSDETSIGMGIYAVLLAPFCEEFAFRGVIFNSAKKLMPPAAAIVLQAALFAAFHMNWIQASYTFIVGLALGYIMYRYNNILVPILLHMLFNVIGTYLETYLPIGGETFISYFAWLLGSLIVSYLGILMVQKGAPGVKIEKRDSDM